SMPSSTPSQLPDARPPVAPRRAANHRNLVLLLGALVALGCRSSRPAAEPPRTVTLTDGPRPAVEFTALDGKPRTIDTAVVRITVLRSGATYAVASQAQARFLSNVARRATPRVNVALLILEPPDNLPLVEAFAKTLDLPYPVALADSETIAGKGPFSG